MSRTHSKCGVSKNWRIYPKGVTPECFYRGSTMLLTTTLSHVEWVGGSSLPVRRTQTGPNVPLDSR